jgi:hypothetical protein
VLSAHRVESQGRPRTTSSSQLISQIGLPVRASLLRPLVPEAPCFRWGRTAVSCPDNGGEFRSGEFRCALDQLGVRHTLIRAGRPQTNGAVEALHRLILEECWRPAFPRYLHVRFTGLKRDLAAYKKS